MAPNYGAYGVSDGDGVALGLTLGVGVVNGTPPPSGWVAARVNATAVIPTLTTNADKVSSRIIFGGTPVATRVALRLDRFSALRLIHRLNITALYP